jgi:hypothetical protein
MLVRSMELSHDDILLIPEKIVISKGVERLREKVCFENGSLLLLDVGVRSKCLLAYQNSARRLH